MTNKILLFLILSILIGCEKSDTSNNITPPVIENPGDNNNQTNDAVVKQINEAEWSSDTISTSIVYKYHHFNDLFKSNQSITIFDIDLKMNPTIDIAYVTSGFLKTSEAAINTRATAAINGGFFNTKIGGSTVFLKRNGEIINYTRSGFDTFREHAGIAIEKSGKVSIIKKPGLGWHTTTSNSVLASGPLLIYDNKKLSYNTEDFNINRHPRTAVGVTDNNHLIAVVVDGRQTQAHGMTMKELSILMDALGCKEALNLDGGGSSTAWLRNRGVINYPSDKNGERGVATVITFTSN